MSAPAYDYAPLPDPDDLAEAVEELEAAIMHLEDTYLARATRAALAEGGESVPAEQVWAELDLRAHPTGARSSSYPQPFASSASSPEMCSDESRPLPRRCAMTRVRPG